MLKGRSRLPLAAVLGALFALAQACGGGSSDGTTPTGGGDTGVSGDGDNDGGDGGDDAATDGGDDTGTGDGGGDGSGDDTGSGGDGTTTDGCVATIPGCGVDSDCDGIADSIEGRFAPGGPIDTDKDGKPDYLDDDSDGDGIPDKLEWRKAGCDATLEENDADGDGIPNFQDDDSDGNGLPDKDEACPPAGVLTKLSMAPCTAGVPYDFDGDGVPDYLDFDNDHDSSKPDKTIGLNDKTELADNNGKYVGLSLDTDGDGIPDVYDVDSDNDFILDLDDGTTDDDGDKIPAFRDTDTDGDGVPDKCEARAKSSPSTADYLLPVLDTDKDGIADYRDLDSDDDLLADGKEDLDGDCTLGSAETDRLKGDTDGDGHGDFVEVTLLGVTGARSATDNPAKAGKFAFIVPYSPDGSKKPTPTSANLALETTLRKGDVAFVVDTTMSMSEEIAELQKGLTTTIIPELSKRFTDLGIGIAGHDDFPTSSEGGLHLVTPAPRPFYIPASGTISTDPLKADAAAKGLTTRQGGLIPEPQAAAMLRALTGQALSWPEGSLAAVSAPSGTYGAMHFRAGSLPILVPITDAAFHNGKRAKNTSPTGATTDYDTTFHDVYPFTAPNIDQLVAKINELGAKVIGVAAADISRTAQLTNNDMPYGDLAYLADKTGSYVPKSAFPGGAFGGCKTGQFGTAITEGTDGPGGTCRLVFSVSTAGAGLSTAIVDGVGALLNALAFDVYVRASKDPADTSGVDAVDAFMESIEPQPSGGVDPVTGGVCVTFSASQLKNKYRTPKALAGAGDINETIGGLNPGKLYCFAVKPKPNTTVTPKTTAQTFKALLTVLADRPSGGTITLGSDREVLFIVPPTLN